MFPAKNLDHLASFLLNSSIGARGARIEGRRIKSMASASPKTLLDFLQPAKRLKIAATPSESTPKSAPSIISMASPDGVASPSDLSPEQKTRIEINRLLARYKRNISICFDRISKNSEKFLPAEGAIDVRLDDLLAEESWTDALAVEFEKPYAKNLCKFLESELRGTTPIYPPQHLIFNALNSTSFDRIKVVIIGQDPYHGPGQAMGLSFSVPEGVKIPSSLANIFKELKEDLGCSIPANGNLERWAVQGVLLLNTVLTVRKNQANSHARKGWEQLTDAIITTISTKKSGVVFLLWGNSAQEKTRLINEARHHVLKAAHPSGLSANRGFFGCRHFSKTNEILVRLQVSPIDWQL